MPTICLDCRYIRPRPSGIGLIVRELVSRLPIIEPNWRFRFLRSSELTETLSDAPNVEEIAVRSPANGPASMWFLPHVADLSTCNLFHSPSNILPAGLSMPTVTTIHDLMWIDCPELCNADPWGRVERVFYRHGIKRAIRKSDAIITVSEATRRDIAAFDSDAGARTTALHPSVSASFQPCDSPAEQLAALGLPKSNYVLTVGQNAPYKNHEGAIRGFAKASAATPSIQLVLVQRRGKRAGTLVRLSQQLGIADRVHFVEAVEESDLVALYSGALALLHPSLREGFGIPIIEAMACGCPVITSYQSAMPEVAGGAALLVDPTDPDIIGEALSSIACDPELSASLRRKGLQRAAELSWDRFAQGHIDIYREVLQLD